MKTLMVHPTGNANVRAAAVGLANADLLREFHTTIATFQLSANDYLKKLGLSEFARRRYDPTLKSFTITHPWLELGRLIAGKAGLRKLTQHEKGLLCTDVVYLNLDKIIAKKIRHDFQKLQAIYAYEDGALQSFKAAKELGLHCIYDLPIGYWRAANQLLEPERERWPEWSSTLLGFQDSETKLSRKDQELKMADQIIVASRFTADTLKAFPGPLSPIVTIPYGFPSVTEERKVELKRQTPLKLLFVGALSQRKGIADLFDAVKHFKKHVQLTVIGNKVTENCKALNNALSEHKYIPSLPHHKILEQMRMHDVLVFPSLFEGFGLVITEAMSQGTPVITTERTAGPDLIRHGENGWLTKAGSTNALIETLEALVFQPSMIIEAGHLAMETARLRPWEKYGQELAQSISDFKK